MPELPDVEGYRRTLERRGLGKRIDHATVRDASVLSCAAQTLRNRLAGRTLKGCCRHGKYLQARLDDDYRLSMHFGMTGALVAGGAQDAEPDTSRVQIAFNDGTWLSFDCPRKLGRLDIHSAEVDSLRLAELGPDALSIDQAAFLDLLEDAKGAIKTTLMDQKRLAGIGNIYADEICFQAGIHPGRKVPDLDRQERKQLYTAMRHILRIASDRRGVPSAMPDSWLLPIRHEDAANCPRCRGELQHIRIGSRRTMVCPRCQA